MQSVFLNRHRGHVVIGIFGLVFALFALGFGFMFVRGPVQGAWDARDWQPVPATLHATANRPPARASLQGMEYRYEFGGRMYSGQRVSLYDGASGTGIDDYHSAMRGRMAATFQRGERMSVWVNPANPAQAMIDRDLKYGFLWFPLGVSGAMAAMGLFFAYLGFAGMGGGRHSPEEAAAALATKRPIHGSSRSSPVGGWLFALVWNGMVAVMLSTGMTPARGVPVFVVWLAAGAFAAVGLWLAWRAILATLRYQRYRKVALDLDSFPAAAGGEVGGTVVVPIAFDPSHRFKATLSAVEHGMAGGNVQNKSFQRTLFQEEGVASAAPAPDGTQLRFRFRVPAEAPASEGYGEALQWTSSTAGRIFVRWTVSLSADVAGADLEEEFEIPVVRAAASAASRMAPAAAFAAGATAMGAPPANEPPLPAGSIKPSFQYSRQGDRIHIVQPPWDKPGKIASPGSVLGGLAFSAVFAGVGVFLFYQHEWLGGTVFFLVGAGMIVAIVGYLAHALAVDVGPDGLSIERSLWGLRLKQVRLPRERIAAIEVSVESSEQSGGAASLTRSVSVRARDGSSHTIAEFIPGQREALALRNLVASRLGLGAAALAGSAAVAQPTAAVVAQPGAKGPRWLKWAGVAVGVAFAADFFYPIVKAFIFRPEPQQQAQSRPTAPPVVRKDASNVERGFRAQYVKVVGEDFAAEVHGADLRLRIGSLRLESTGKLPEAPYYNLGVYVQQRGRPVGQADDGEFRGTLAAGAPAVTIRDKAFVIGGAGAACQQGGCEARLVLAVQTSANSFHGENTDFATLEIRQTQDIAAAVAEPSKYWDSYFGRATQAMNEGRLDEALRLFDETVTVLRSSNGADHPLEALVLLRRAYTYGRQKDTARQEQSFLRAAQILEPRSAAEIKRAVGVDAWFDKEMLAREIGDFYWEQRRYADAHGYYLKAWEAAPGLDTTEYSRNLKRAFSSAGVMVTACTLGKWDLADSAMAELKERYPKVEPESQRKLKYWIDTGEPRLKARKC